MSLVRASGPLARLGALPAAGFAPIGMTLTVDEVIAGLDQVAPEGVAAVELPDPEGLLVVASFLPDPTLAAALSGDGGQACWALWQGLTDSYAFSSLRGGTHVRQLVRSGGQAVIDEGTPLPVEASLDWSDGDAALTALVAAATGLALGSEGWGAMTVEVHRSAPLPPDVSPLSSGPPPKNKRWFNR